MSEPAPRDVDAAGEVDWEAIARACTHPLRVRIMEHAAAAPRVRFTPAELATAWGEPLGNVAHHVRSLHGQGRLAAAGEKQVRGGVAHYYRAGKKLLVTAA